MTRAALSLFAVLALSCAVEPPTPAPMVGGERVSAPVVQHPEAVAGDGPDLPDVVYEDSWRGANFGGILLPKETLAVDDDGGVDLAIHFHGGQMATRFWRHSGFNAVIASAGYGLGSHAYSAAMADGARFTAPRRRVAARRR